jgi:hypothetical protein
MIADTEPAAHADDAADAARARTFQVRTENLPALRERIDRRARRLGTGPVVLVDTERRQAGRAVVVLEGDTPRLEGWRIATVVRHRGADAELRPVPGRRRRLTGRRDSTRPFGAWARGWAFRRGGRSVPALRFAHAGVVRPVQAAAAGAGRRVLAGRDHVGHALRRLADPCRAARSGAADHRCHRRCLPGAPRRGVRRSHQPACGATGAQTTVTARAWGREDLGGGSDLRGRPGQLPVRPHADTAPHRQATRRGARRCADDDGQQSRDHQPRCSTSESSSPT